MTEKMDEFRDPLYGYNIYTNVIWIVICTVAQVYRYCLLFFCIFFRILFSVFFGILIYSSFFVIHVCLKNFKFCQTKCLFCIFFTFLCTLIIDKLSRLNMQKGIF